MSEEDRHRCFQNFGLVFVSWISRGERNHVLGRCLDISNHGLGIELPKALPPGGLVTVQADWLDLTGLASVRQSAKRAGKWVLHLEFDVPLRQDALDRLLASLETGGASTTSATSGGLI
jgi:hypothetical protein